MAQEQESIENQFERYLAEEGFVDRSGVNVHAELSRLTGREIEKLLKNATAYVKDPLREDSYYNLAAERISGIPIYEWLNSRIYDAKKNMMSDIIKFGQIGLGSKVLDIGCGTGLETAFLGYVVGKEGKVVGVDIAKAALDVARERAERRKLTNIEFIEADRDNLPFEDNYFDTAVSSLSFNDGERKFGLMDILRYRRRMRGIKRVLKDGGRICAVENSTPKLNKNITRNVLTQFRLGGFWDAESFARDFILHNKPPYSYVFAHAEKGN